MDADSPQLSLLAKYAKWRLHRNTPVYNKMIVVFFLILSIVWFFNGDWKLGVLMLAVSFMFFVELGYAELFKAAYKTET
ncbi:MAG: hypothetical protein QNJ56_12260 [Gammaproteobacteria bacterium]|nr:hypothetical protein [Gammaproteobacteria bacterium]